MIMKTVTTHYSSRKNVCFFANIDNNPTHEKWQSVMRMFDRLSLDYERLPLPTKLEIDHNS